MDRNTLIGISLIVVIFLAFSYINRPTEEQKEAARKRRQAFQDSIERVKIEKEKEKAKELAAAENTNTEFLGETDSLKTDSARQTELVKLYDVFAGNVTGEQNFVTLENNKIKVRFSTKGGRPYSVELKGYKRFDSTQVSLFDGDDNHFGFKFYANNRRISTEELFFETDSPSDVIVSETDTAKTVRFKLAVSPEKFIEYKYTLKPDDFLMDYDVNFVGMDEYLAHGSSYLDFIWQIDVPGQEKGREWETRNTTVYYKPLGEEVDYLSEGSDIQTEQLTARGKWVAFKQQFFSSILVADENFDDFEIRYETNPASEKHIMNFLAKLTFPYEGSKKETIGLQLYFGPNKHKILKQYDLEFEELIPLGWGIFGWVNMFIVIPLFNFLGSFISNYGLIIFLMTVIIKVGLFPLTYKSYLSTAKMRVLKPEVEEINKKFPKQEDAMKKQQAVMAMYKKAGANPMGGCLPMVLQMPILFAMFKFFPASIELRQKSFLWADDLSTYDSVLDLPFNIMWYGDHVSLFCLLMAASMVLTTRMNSSQMDTSSSQMPGMKMMMYLMPVMMLVWFNSYSSGLSYYYLLSNIITFIQTIAIRRFVDDEEILRKLQANKKKPAKKSGFQKRLEDMAKKQQQAKKKK